MSSPEFVQLNQYLPIVVYGADVNEQYKSAHKKLFSKIKGQIKSGLFDRINLKGILNPNVLQGLLEAVQLGGTIRVLEMTYPSITPKEIIFEEEGMTHLAKFIQTSTTLRALIFQGVQFSKLTPLTRSLVENPALTYLKMENCYLRLMEITSLTFALQRKTNLTYLDLSKNYDMGSAGLVSLPSMLIANQNLRELTLQQCRITFFGLQILAQGIQYSRLTRIALDANFLSRGLKHLGKVVSRHPTIEEVSISSCELNANDIKDFAEELINPSIQKWNIPTTLPILTLNLGNNLIGSEGISYISEGMSRSQRKYRLGLDFCGLDEKSVETLCNALRNSSCLEGLNLSRNQIKDHGVIQFSEALETNTSLTEFWIEGCGITDLGASKLAHAVQNHTLLKKINVKNNPIDIHIEGALELKAAIKSMPALPNLNLIPILHRIMGETEENVPIEQMV